MEVKVENPVDQELDRLDNDIRKLKIEYDIYFNGGAVRPPVDSKSRVETLIKRIYDMRNLSFSQRFRYNSLVARYNVMRELWRRQAKGHEESGRPPTAEAMAALRERQITVRCNNPHREPDKVSEIYNQLVAAKRDCGERVGGLTLEVFTQFLSSRAEQIKQNLKSEEIDFIVGVDKGQVKFTARPASDERESDSSKNE